MKFPQICKYLPVLSMAVVCNLAIAADADLAGVPNFHQVSNTVYRGAQPTDEGWTSLAKIGVKTIIDLRLPNEHSTAAEEKAVTAAGMRYINIPMEGVVTPSEASISKALSLMNSTTEGPVFVHCRRGADRTGTVIAVYRMSHDRWGNDKAMHEAKSYGMAWTQVGLKHYISSYRVPDVVASASTVSTP